MFYSKHLERKKYQIIYADPPWDVKRGPDWNSNGASKPLPYPTMTVEEIEKIPVKGIIENNAVLFLWTINKYIRQSYEVAEAWGFNPACLLTYCKPCHGLGIGGTFVQTSEHLLFCRKGTLRQKSALIVLGLKHLVYVIQKNPLFFVI